MRKKLFLILSILVLFIFIGNVYAEETNEAEEEIEDDFFCSISDLSKLRAMAAKIKVSYVPGEMEDEMLEPDPENGVTNSVFNYVDVKMYNMTSQLKAIVTIQGDGVNEQKTVDFKNIDTNGDESITFRQQASNSNVEYTFEIYGVYKCTIELLRTIKITIPKYNFYSSLPVCKEIPDYYLCQPYITFDAGNDVYSKIEAYKEKVANNVIVDINAEKTNIVSQTTSFFSKYKYIVVGIIVAIGVFMTMIIVKRKKRKE